MYVDINISEERETCLLRPKVTLESRRIRFEYAKSRKPKIL